MGVHIRALCDGDWETRWRAVKALECLGKIDLSSVEFLIQALRDEHWLVQGAAARALVKIGRPCVELLARCLEDSDWRVQAVAAWALGEIGDISAADHLLQCDNIIAKIVSTTRFSEEKAFLIRLFIDEACDAAPD